MTAREVIGEYLAAIQARDRDRAFALYADDAVMHIPGRSAFAGERRGREAIVAYIRAAVARADEGTEVELVDTLSGESDRVALLLRETLRSARGEFVMRCANVYTAAKAKSHGAEVQVELVDMLASEERVMLIVRERFTRSGRIVDIGRANVYTIRGEEICEIWIYEDDQYAVDELFEEA